MKPKEVRKQQDKRVDMLSKAPAAVKFIYQEIRYTRKYKQIQDERTGS